MSTGGNLGGAAFAISANTAPFTKGMQQAQQQAQQTTQAIGAGFQGLQIIPRQLAAINQSIMNTTNAIAQMQAKASGFKGLGGAAGAGGGFGGMGSNLLIFSQALDDAQYGMRALVNNAPQVGMALGSALGLSAQGAMALGGGLGVAAVAVNTLAQNWETWFGTAKKLPEIKGGLEELTSALGKVKEQLDPLRDAMRDFREGNRGVFGEMADQLGFGAASLKNRLRFEELSKREKEAQERIGAERGFKALGPSDVERENAAAFGKAVRALPGGKEQLLGTLQERGMGREEALKAIAGAAGGNSGYAGDIVGKLTAQEKRGAFRGFMLALPSERRKGEKMAGISEEMGDQAEAQAGRRRERDDRTRRLMHENERQMGEEAAAQERARREHGRRAEQAGGFLARSRLGAVMAAGVTDPFQKKDMEGQIGRQLKRAGFQDVSGAEGFKALQKETEERIGQIMLQRNVGEGEARMIAMRENISANMPEEMGRERPRQEYRTFGLVEFQKHLQERILNGAAGADKVPDKQLKVQEEMVKLLRDISSKGFPAVAVN